MVHPVVRIRSMSPPAGPSTRKATSSVVLIEEDGHEVDISNLVTRVVWDHDAQSLPVVSLVLVPDADIEAEGFSVHLFRPDPEPDRIDVEPYRVRYDPRMFLAEDGYDPAQWGTVLGRDTAGRLLVRWDSTREERWIDAACLERVPVD